MKLGALLDDAVQGMKDAVIKNIRADAVVTGITDDTRSFESGMIFVCMAGRNFDGHDAAAEMMEKGAVCVVCERDIGLEGDMVLVPDARRFYGLLCAAWFGHPEQKLRLIGVTGTNGKTTMATMIASVLSGSGKKVGFIGTTGVQINGKDVERDESTPTTPRVSELYGLFAKMADEGCEFAVMEVSSFALEQNRIGPAVYEAAAFTNLTRDHLDYHGDMENYYLAKKKLFTSHCRTAFINIDDEYGERLYNETECRKLSYSDKRTASVYASDVHTADDGMAFTYNDTETGRTYPVKINMLGAYNVSNAVAAIGICTAVGLTAEEAVRLLSVFPGVRGRCEIIPTKRDFMIICDYAHSPDALENMLPVIKENTANRLICLFGCGGDRDRTKRPLMAKAVERYADHIIVTSDNPRNEDPEAIIDEVAAGFAPGTAYDRIADRREAIFHAVNIAKKGDIIVLAGKGHEDYQILENNRHIHFDEREIAAEALAALDGDRREKLTLGEICAAVGGKGYGFDPETCVYADEISSDTRTITKGSLFFGIKGEKFDGNEFAASAVSEKGAVCSVTDRVLENDLPCIVVNDTRKALLALAGWYRRRLGTVVVGITGSVGKTTSKEMIWCALGSKYDTLKTEGNHNNEIGLPFTLFKMTGKTQAAVIEMGMSHFGELTALSAAAEPDICVITNIGYSHIENLGSREGILKAKLEILNGAKPDAALIINSDDDMLRSIADKCGSRRVITCGINDKNADYTAENIKSSDEGITFELLCRENGRRIVCSIPVLGEHHVMDALLAVAAAAEAGCDIESAVGALKGYTPSGLRMHIEKHGANTVIVDCYNAAPASVNAAIDVLRDRTPENGGRRVFVFGDMLELGDMSEELHRAVGAYAAENGVDMLVCVGRLAGYAAESAKEKGVAVFASEDAAEAEGYLREALGDGDIVLFKGSRGMHLEKLIKALWEKEK